MLIRLFCIEPSPAHRNMRLSRFQSIWNFSESHLLWIQGWEKLKYILKLKLNEFVATNFRNLKKMMDGRWQLCYMYFPYPHGVSHKREISEHLQAGYVVELGLELHHRMALVTTWVYRKPIPLLQSPN